MPFTQKEIVSNKDRTKSHDPIAPKKALGDNEEHWNSTTQLTDGLAMDKTTSTDKALRGWPSNNQYTFL